LAALVAGDLTPFAGLNGLTNRYVDKYLLDRLPLKLWHSDSAEIEFFVLFCNGFSIIA